MPAAGDASKERAVDLVHTILFRNLRRTLPATNLAVRQVIIKSCLSPSSVSPFLTVGCPLPHLEARSVDFQLCIPELADQVTCHWQEHVDLLRALALAFPARYPDLHALTDTDAELDFFNNVAHLQLHRRSRAFRRLANVGSPLLASHRNCLSDDAAMS